MEKNLLEKLIVIHLVKISPAFIDPECLLPFSQGPATGLYPEPDACSLNLRTLFT